MKRVLVFEDPQNCRMCPCFDSDYIVCKAAKRSYGDGMQVQIKRGDKCRPTWCPAKDLPEYKMDWNKDVGSYEAGWNDVLDLVGGRE